MPNRRSEACYLDRLACKEASMYPAITSSRFVLRLSQLGDMQRSVTFQDWTASSQSCCSHMPGSEPQIASEA